MSVCDVMKKKTNYEYEPKKMNWMACKVIFNLKRSVEQLAQLKYMHTGPIEVYVQSIVDWNE